MLCVLVCVYQQIDRYREGGMERQLKRERESDEDIYCGLHSIRVCWAPCVKLTKMTSQEVNQPLQTKTGRGSVLWFSCNNTNKDKKSADEKKE